MAASFFRFGKKTPPPSSPEEQVAPAPALPTVDEKLSTTPKRKEATRTRDTVLKLRLTAAEAEEISRLAENAGQSKTEFLLAAARGHTSVRVEGVPEILEELRRQGVNLNQAVLLAHKYQTTQVTPLKEAVASVKSSRKIINAFCTKWDATIEQIDKGGGNHGDIQDGSE